MSLDREWDSIRPDRSFRAANAGMSILRITLLFGSAAVALALIAVPVLDKQTRSSSRDALTSGLDTISTGSVGSRATYTLRRSVLQPSPSSVCIIRADGRRSGDC
ncbi:hypothetical protein FJV76_10670 [Mesorhizobium sp. WSM4303]|uniref:hypothetical protein n=1 Tax=unclassified Mesorhizobium TaxID=325217 RepID=UPI00115D5C13|nr:MULTISPECIES: hypothetical protein [unclassified Mesorhizobium]TRC97843.1 hypothetical protein FJV77_08605 [Mesorhizobium sp. WSM4306]TRD05079.1 hypothetical protein FJV76_10670 [Mesorhizobium sp. WSM4303]